MKQLIVLNLLLLLIFPELNLLAQDEDISFTFFGHYNVPTSRFSEKIGADPKITRRFGFDFGEKAGLANPGYGLGVEMAKPIFIDNLAWVISSKLIVNPVDVSEINSFFKDELGDTIGISFENGNWLNIPIFTGFSYGYDFTKNFSLCGTVQCGINITQQASRKAVVEGNVVENTTFKITPDFGFEAGIGFELFKKYNLGVRYLNLGSPRYEGTRKLNEKFFTSIPKREMNVDGDERPISMVLIMLGYKF